MLIGRQSEGALMDLGDLPKSCLEISIGFVLDTSVFHEDGIVVPAIFSSSPAVVIDVSIKGVWPSGGKLVSKAFLKVCLESIKPHTIDGVLESCILRGEG